MDYKKVLADRVQHDEKSAIRELLKAASNKNLISLAGGFPAPETFPTPIIQSLVAKVITNYGNNIFQYGITEGLPEFRKNIAKYVRERSVTVGVEDVAISTGAQTAIDAAAKILINKGDKLAIEAPTFLAAIKTFKIYEPKFVSIPMDESGITVDGLEKIFQGNIKMIYIIPNFQNPTGVTLSLPRRKEVARLAQKYDTIILEDDPYFELRYNGEHLPSIYSLAPENTIYIGSLSKVFSPGMRLGYYIAQPQLSKLMTSVRQGVDVHANTFSQAIANYYLEDGHLEKQLTLTKKTYKSRMTAMLDSLEKYFPVSFSWSKPDGGMYIWVTGPDNFDAKKFGKKTLKKLVAIVPGQFFFVNSVGHENTFRLNFTNTDEAKIESAIKTISKLL